MADPEIIGTEALATEVGVSRQMIGRWAREGLSVAKIAHGKWNRELALSWIADRREDSLNQTGFDRSSPSDINLHRARLYSLQADGQQLRNGILESNLVFRDSAVAAYTEATQEMISAGDSWSRDAGTPAAKALVGSGLTQAQILALKRELWNELRGRESETIRRVAGTLSAGEDVGSARVRLPRRVGG